MAHLPEERKSISYKIIHDIISTSDRLHNVSLQQFQEYPQCSEIDNCYTDWPKADKPQEHGCK
jgi:hypothetical protein